MYETSIITHSCGHTVEISYDWVRCHPRKTEWMESTLCKECYHKERLAEAKKINNHFGLKKLEGSKKQVEWAESIRADKAKILYGWLDGCIDMENIQSQFTKREWEIPFDLLYPAIEQLLASRDAKFWIDHREERLGTLLAKGAKKVIVDQHLLNRSLAAELARAEATLTPGEPIRGTSVEISIDEEKGEVHVKFPYRDRDFWEVIRRKLDFTWQGKFWIKTTEMTGVDVVNLATEAGHHLFDEGYKVTVWDEMVRKKIKAADYTPSLTRWVFVDDDGNFALKWRYYDDLYKQARKINGSKYKKPYVRVAVSEYNELLDFAEIYDFRLTEEAEMLVREQERIRLEETILDLPEAKINKARRSRKNLYASEVAGEIDADLRDD